MSETRPCLVSQSFGEPKTAKFHRFIEDKAYTESNDTFPYTKALVEYDNGRLVKVEVDDIQFQSS